MLISVSDAAAQLDDLMSEVEAGGEIVLTRQGRAIARLVAMPALTVDRDVRRAVLENARAQAQETALAGESAAHSQNFLYADDGTAA